MTLYRKEYGSGRPVILLHGLLGSSDNWHSIATLLADDFFVIAPDLRNHGRSPHTNGFSYDLLAADITGLIEEYDLEPPVVVGHSLGGKTAMRLALSYPEMVRALAVEDMTPGETAPISGKYITLLRQLDIGRMSRRKDAEELLQQRVPERRTVLFLLKNLYRLEDGSFGFRVNLESLEANYSELWGALEHTGSWDGECLFLRGERSDVVADEAFGEIFSLFPNSRIVTIEGAGHWVHGDSPTEFLIHLEQFLHAAYA